MLPLIDQWLIHKGRAPRSSTPTQPIEPPVPARTPLPTPTVERRRSQKFTTLGTTEPAKCTEVPEGAPLPGPLVRLEPPQPLAAINDNPVFDTVAAAEIIGVDAETLKKWRQRDQGPDYIRYGHDGLVRYALSALQAFREAHTVRIKNQPRTGGRRRRRAT